MVAGTRSGRGEEGNTESACPCSRLIAAVTALTSDVWGSCLLPCSQHLLDQVGGDGEASLEHKATPVAPHLVEPQRSHTVKVNLFLLWDLYFP